MLCTRFALAATIVIALTTSAFAQDKPRKVAFLVGVGKYDFAFTDLGKAPENDVTKLAGVLKDGGFEVVILTSSGTGKDRATRANVEARFKAILDGGDGKPALKKADTLLVHLCGHGIQIDGQAYFCPADAKPDAPETMAPLNGLIRASEASGGTVLFLVDACREVKDANRSRTGIQGKKVELPAKTAVLFSCGQGQLAQQNEKLGHGLFTHAVIQTLKGETGLKEEVSWSQLVAGVETQFRSAEFKSMIPAGKPQAPVLATGELDFTPLVSVKGDSGTLAIGRKAGLDADTAAFLNPANWDGAKALWVIKGDTLTGKWNGPSPTNTYIYSKQKYGDFELSFKVKMTGDGNSGVQIRSDVLDRAKYIVRGPQVELGLLPSTKQDITGSLYSESGGANSYKLSPPKPLQRQEWDEFRIVAKGNHVTIRVNGETTVDADFQLDGNRFPVPPTGIVGFQLHKSFPNMQIEFKEIQFKVLK